MARARLSRLRQARPRRPRNREANSSLAEEPGPGHLWISARVEGAQLRLLVEDDGMGLRSREESQGMGLANVAERLATLYQDRASLVLEAREGGGCRVTLSIPR